MSAVLDMRLTILALIGFLVWAFTILVPSPSDSIINGLLDAAKGLCNVASNPANIQTGCLNNIQLVSIGYYVTGIVDGAVTVLLFMGRGV